MTLGWLFVCFVETSVFVLRICWEATFFRAPTVCCSLAMVAEASLTCLMSNFRSGWSDFVAPSEDWR